MKRSETKNRIVIYPFLLLFLVIAISSAQVDRGNNPDVRGRLEMIERGQGDAVKAELPTLMTNFQNHPGVLYLQAVLITDGAEAAKLYQSIVDNFPTNEWADDALYKLYQYYYLTGLYKTADQKFEQLKREYPYSAYASLDATPKPMPKPRAQAPPAEVKPKDTPAKFTTSFTVQVGAFSTMQNAEELKTRFEREKYSCSIFTVVRDGKKLFKVWVGEFKTHEEAKSFTSVIKRKFNLESIVVSR